MRIAVDLDGVLADLHTPFLLTAHRLFPDLDVTRLPPTEGASAPPDEFAAPAEESETAASPQKTAALSRRQTDRIWREIAATENFWETLNEIEPGAIASLARTADERGWEVLFITSRPTTAGATVQRQSQRWLERHGFPLPSLFVVHGSRGRIAKALAIDVVLDDRDDNCLDVVLESSAGSVLVWRGGDDTVPASTHRLGIVMVPTVAAAIDAVVEAERAAASGGGVVERLLKMFGLKPKTRSALLR